VELARALRADLWLFMVIHLLYGLDSLPWAMKLWATAFQVSWKGTSKSKT